MDFYYKSIDLSELKLIQARNDFIATQDSYCFDI